jgi:hypothetical protein
MVHSPALYLISTSHHTDEPHAPWVSATVYNFAVAATPTDVYVHMFYDTMTYALLWKRWNTSLSQ